MTTMTPLSTATEVVSVDDLKVRYGDTLAVDGVSLASTAARSSASSARTAPARPPPSSASAACASRSRVRSACSVWTRARRPRSCTSASVSSCRPRSCRTRSTCARRSSCSPRSTRTRSSRPSCCSSCDLEEKAETRYVNLSGGQRQRLSIALALVGRPELAILDELTTGLDPQSRRETWKLIEGIRDQGLTVILVTHFMEEAEYLCDRVALLHHGRIRAIDTPANLGAGLGQRISFRQHRRSTSTSCARCPRSARSTSRAGAS